MRHQARAPAALSQAVVGAGLDQRAQHGRRRIDALDEAPRALGDKHAVLHARRLKLTAPTPARPFHVGAQHVLASQVVPVAFVLRATSQGLLIERSQGERLGPRLTQTLVMADSEAFERWCAAEPVRFEDPVLFDQLRRDGHDALALKR
jgi:hypothetical protein